MASLLSRIVASFDAIKPVPNLTGLDGEHNQLVGASGVLNGNSTASKLLIKTSDGSDPPVDIDQVGAGPLARFKQNGSTKVTLSNAGLFTMVNTAVNTGFNADQVDGIEGANIAKLDTNIVPFSLAWFIDDPSTFPLTSDDSGLTLFRVPPIVGGFVSKLTIIRTAGTHAGGGSVTFKARIFNGSTLGSGVSFNDTNNAANTVYTDDFTDVGISEGNYLLVHITARSGTVSERHVSVNIEGYRKLS